MTIPALVTAIIGMAANLPQSASFSLSEDNAKLNVEAATKAAEKYSLPVELLLGQALIESRYDTMALSRRACDDDGKNCKRVTTPWTSHEKPPHAFPTYYCGVSQTGGNISWEECDKMRTDLVYAYETGAKELTIWMHDPHCASLPDDDRLQCALAGYGAGYSGVSIYTTLQYPKNVLWAMSRIKQLAEHADKQNKS
jgi:hypothetical protein